MTVSLLGVPFLLIALIAATLRPAWLAPLLIVSAIFEGAAALQFASFALSPYYVVAIFVGARCLYLLFCRRLRWGDSPAMRLHLGLLFVFTAWAALSAPLLPRAFEGTSVFAPRLGIDSQVGSGTPLSPSISNLGQILYLLLNVAVVLYLARRRERLERLLYAFRWAGALALAIALYQAVALRTGLPFPDEILLNHPFRAQAFGATSGGVPRLNGTFTESSQLAIFFGTFATFCFVSFLTNWKRRVLDLFLAAGSIAILTLSTSSTAYLAIVGLAASTVLVFGIAYAIRRRRASARLSWLVLLATFLFAATLITSPRLQGTVYRATILKGTSGSAVARFAADARAFEITLETGGVGVGLGSNRSSSFLAWLLSNTGIIGIVTLLGSAAILFYGLLHRATPNGLALAWALGALLIMKSISSPDLAAPLLWIVWGLGAAEFGRSLPLPPPRTKLARPADGDAGDA